MSINPLYFLKDVMKKHANKETDSAHQISRIVLTYLPEIYDNVKVKKGIIRCSQSKKGVTKERCFIRILGTMEPNNIKEFYRKSLPLLEDCKTYSRIVMAWEMTDEAIRYCDAIKVDRIRFNGAEWSAKMNWK